MKRRTPHFSPDGFHRSKFAFLSSVFANCVFLLFFPLSSYSSRSQTGMTSCRGEVRLEYVPTRPCRRTGDQRREGLSAQRGDEVFIREENIKPEKVIPGTDEALCQVLQQHVDWNVENVRSVLTWWWGEIEGTQMGWEGFWWKGTGRRSNKYIRMEKKGT